jgi:hypothetical protein
MSLFAGAEEELGPEDPDEEDEDSGSSCSDLEDAIEDEIAGDED